LGRTGIGASFHASTIPTTPFFFLGFETNVETRNLVVFLAREFRGHDCRCSYYLRYTVGVRFPAWENCLSFHFFVFGKNDLCVTGLDPAVSGQPDSKLPCVFAEANAFHEKDVTYT